MNNCRCQTVVIHKSTFKSKYCGQMHVLIEKRIIINITGEATYSGFYRYTPLHTHTHTRTHTHARTRAHTHTHVCVCNDKVILNYTHISNDRQLTNTYVLCMDEANTKICVCNL